MRTYRQQEVRERAPTCLSCSTPLACAALMPILEPGEPFRVLRVLGCRRCEPERFEWNTERSA